MRTLPRLMPRTVSRAGAATLLRLVWTLTGLAPQAVASGSTPGDFEMFAAIPAARSTSALDWILYVGPLSPESGAADLLVALAGWAEQHPDRPIEITWAGVGDLAGVFEAQPLPCTLTQRFVGELDRAALAEAFADASILAAPLSDNGGPVLEALAAGLVVIGGRRAPAMRSIVGVHGPAWSYDERSLLDLAATLSAALDEKPEARDARRRAGRLLAHDIRAAEAVRLPAAPRRLVSSEAL